MSNLIELAGLVLLAVAAFLLAGVAVCLGVAAVELLLIGWALDGLRIHVRVEREDRPQKPKLRRVG